MSGQVLAVDDSATIRRLLATTLTEAGYDVVTAVDGEDALHTLGPYTPDLVITDLNMPRMDGLALVEALRGRAETAFTPVLVLTTETASELRDHAHEAGASGWIVKPFVRDDLLSAAELLVG